MNPFGHWKEHDVAAHNERMAKRLGAGAAERPAGEPALKNPAGGLKRSASMEQHNVPAQRPPAKDA